MPATSPSLSIVIPSLNQAPYLEKSIKSIIDQNYPALELIIIDGNSTDGSKKILDKYSQSISWWCSEPDSGQTQALNKGFARATGEIMAWLNADDRLLPGSLARATAFLEANPKVDAVYGHRILINDQDREVGRWILPSHNDRVLTWADFIPQETLFWRRSLWERVGGRLDESYHFAMDWDLLLRFRRVGAKMYRLPYFLGLFRIHPVQKTCSQIDKVGFEEMQRLRTQHLGYTPRQYRVAIGTINYLLRARILELLWNFGLKRYG